MEINLGSISGAPAVYGQIDTESFTVCWSDQSRSNRGKCQFYGGAILYLPLVRKQVTFDVQQAKQCLMVSSRLRASTLLMNTLRIPKWVNRWHPATFTRPYVL